MAASPEGRANRMGSIKAKAPNGPRTYLENPDGTVPDLRNKSGKATEPDTNDDKHRPKSSGKGGMLSLATKQEGKPEEKLAHPSDKPSAADTSKQPTANSALLPPSLIPSSLPVSPQVGVVASTNDGKPSERPKPRAACLRSDIPGPRRNCSRISADGSCLGSRSRTGWQGTAESGPGSGSRRRWRCAVAKSAIGTAFAIFHRRDRFLRSSRANCRKFCQPTSTWTRLEVYEQRLERGRFDFGASHPNDVGLLPAPIGNV